MYTRQFQALKAISHHYREDVQSKDTQFHWSARHGWPKMTHERELLINSRVLINDSITVGEDCVIFTLQAHVIGFRAETKLKTQTQGYNLKF